MCNNAMKYEINERKNNNEIIPTKEEAIKLLNDLKLEKHIIKHCIKVSKKALDIALKIAKNNRHIDLKLVEIGALLHDIGRIRTHSLAHAVEGGKIIKELGFSKKLSRIAETHILGGLTKDESIKLGLPPKDYLPTTIEEKIVCYADKLVKGQNDLSIEERFKTWNKRYGNTELLKSAKERVKRIENEIKNYIKN